jgi:hypothetical protein
MGGPLLDEQFADPQAQGPGEPLDVDEADVAAAAFDVGEVSAVDAGLLGQVFLGEAELLTPGTDGVAEAFADVGRAGPTRFGASMPSSRWARKSRVEQATPLGRQSRRLGPRHAARAY